MTKRRKIKRNRGDVVRLDLGNDHFGFGQLLRSPLVAFFDLRSNDTPRPEEIVRHQVAFSVWVMNYAITDGDWPVIGHAEVGDDIDELPPFFKRDPISDKLSITYTGAEEIPATLSEVENLECAAVWEPEHIVDRLNDYFEGRSNKWVESLKPGNSRRK